MIDILVLDEADRMIADGHFKELKLILNHIYTQRVEYKKEAIARNKQNKLNKKAGIEAPKGKLGMDVMLEKTVLKMKDSSKTNDFKVGHNLEKSESGLTYDPSKVVDLNEEEADGLEQEEMVIDLGVKAMPGDKEGESKKRKMKN